MKKIILVIIFTILSKVGICQILPGSLDVTGFPTISQNFSDLVTEAGNDDGINGFESAFNATEIAFILDPIVDPTTGLELESSFVCSEYVFRYQVYMHTVGVPANMIIEAKTISNGGDRFPADGIYDNLLIQPLGPRNLSPENGGNYIQIPNDGNNALKVMEFIGCRENIPIQFRVKASSLANETSSNINVVYTVVGSLN